MLAVSVYVFFGFRDFPSEFLTRQVLENALEKNSGWINYSDVKTTDDWYKFMTTTFAFQVLESKRTKLTE